MKLEDMVTSLELSKRLKKLAVKRESLFYWHNVDTVPSVIYGNWHSEWSGDFQYSAFSVAELLEILPAHLDIKQNEPFNNFWLRIDKRNTESIRYIVVYYCDSVSAQENLFFPAKLCGFYDKNLANCLAKMLIHLIENGLIEV